MGEPARGPVHMVDGDSNFCKANVDRMINSSAELTDPKAPYAVVSIVGAQSSGKSYLMNHLFGTEFPVMDASRGWSQTSRGIMMSRCIRPSLLLLDVEGFDGKEKGEDTLFEKQSALFALAVSDLMMVNMHTQAIGLQQGSGANLFRIIFQERTKLVGAGFTKILVVLRDNTGETPVETLRRQILESMQKIWKDVNNESVKFNDYIEVNVVALPHKMFPEFQTEVTKLRQLLSDNRSSKVPASGFSLSSSIFWDTIKKNKELDIPTHQVTLAKLYCRQLVDDIINSLDSQKEYKLLKAEQSPVRFREISHDLLEKNKAAYNQKAEMYDPAVRAEERQYMVERLHKIFTNDSRELIWKVHESTLQDFKSAFYKNIENMKEDDADLYFEPIVEGYIDRLMGSCEDLKEFDLDYLRMIGRELRKKMQSYVAINTVRVKVTIARLNCPQLVKDILNSFTSQEKYKLLQDEKSPWRFKEISHELLEETKAEYNLKTKMYDRDIRDQEGQYLEERLHEIIKGESRELIQKVKKSTLQQFKCDNDGKNIQSMNGNEASLYFEPIVDACISKFMSSCKDEKVFDSENLRRVCGEVEKKLQSYTGQLVKEREREIKAAKDAKNAARIALHSVLAAGNIGVGIGAACLGQLYAIPAAVAGLAASVGVITSSAVELNEKSDSPSTSQDQDCDKSD